MFEITMNVHRGFNSNACELEHGSDNLNTKKNEEFPFVIKKQRH